MNRYPDLLYSVDHEKQMPSVEPLWQPQPRVEPKL